MDGSQKDLENSKPVVGVNIRIFEEKPSGIQNFIQGLFSQLVREKKYEYFFFTTGPKKIEETSKYINPNSWLLNVIKRIDRRLLNIFFDNIYVLKLIKSEKINIFIAPSFILPIFKPKGVYFVTVIHDLSFLTYKNNPFKIYMNLVMYMKTLMPFILKRADIVIVPSNYVKNEIKRIYKVNSDKIRVIYEGKDPFFYPNKDKNKFEEIKKQYNIGNNFLFTNATNQERKNVFGLIQAFTQINKYNQYQLAISGLLPEKNQRELEQYILNNNLTKKIKYLGYVSKEELRILYSFARLFIFPSFEEGFGLPILESSSCDCLPICSNTGSLPEVMGDRNLLFNPRDINSMTAKINEVLAWDDQTYTSNLKLVKTYTDKFSWEKTAEEYSQSFEKLIEVQKTC